MLDRTELLTSHWGLFHQWLASASPVSWGAPSCRRLFRMFGESAQPVGLYYLVDNPAPTLPVALSSRSLWFRPRWCCNALHIEICTDSEFQERLAWRQFCEDDVAGVAVQKSQYLQLRQRCQCFSDIVPGSGEAVLEREECCLLVGWQDVVPRDLLVSEHCMLLVVSAYHSVFMFLNI